MAGRIPQSFINDLLDRVDIVGVIDARVKLKKAGKDYQACCPFHDEKTPSFTVSPDKQFYYCFGCGESGTALTFLMEYDHMDFVPAVETLAAVAGVEVPREESAKPQRDNTDLYGLMVKAERYFRKALKESEEAIGYLKSRGLTGIAARDFGIGFAPESWDGVQKALAPAKTPMLLEAGLITKNDKGRTYDRFRGRIMFPIRDTRGRVIAFGGRLLGDGDGPKYLNSPETPIFHKSYELYGLYEARKAVRRLTSIIVVEGYMDVVALAQAGVPNVVATLGTASGESHYQKLYRYTDEVICAFDGDQAGRRAAWRALENALATLTEGRQLKFLFLPDGEDPDSLVRAKGSKDFLERVRNATPAIEYLFAQLASGLDLNTIDARAKLASLAMPMIERVPDGTLKHLMLARVQELTGLATRPAARSQGRRRSKSDRRRVDGLPEHLLASLLKRPTLLQVLSETEVQALANLPEGKLLSEVVRYIAENPQAEPAQVLGRWSGDEQHDELIRLFERQSVLDEDATRAEFTDGAARLLAARDQQNRRRLLNEMRENPSADKLVEFWTLKRGSTGDKIG